MSNPSFVHDDSFWGGFQSGAEQELAENRGANTWEWIANNGDDAIGLINGVLCTIKPERPGCPGSVPRGGGAFIQQNNTPLYLLIAIVLILVVVIIFKK
jgi:hypothetical protein